MKYDTEYSYQTLVEHRTEGGKHATTYARPQLVLRSSTDPLELEMQPQRLIRLVVNLKRSDTRS